MFKRHLTHGVARQRPASRDRVERRSARSHTRFQPYRPSVEALEDRTLLSFLTAPTYAVGANPVSAAVGDFNGDGHLDLAVANGGTNRTPAGTVSILLGKGDGTFGAAQSYAIGNNPTAVAVGDFDGDGHLDLAVTNGGSYPNYQGSVSVLLGKGDGTFGVAKSYATGSYSVAVAVGDFNGDRLPDLAVANSDSGTVTVVLGKGD